MCILNELGADRFQLLKSNSIFNDLPRATIEEIDRAKIQNNYKKGQTIFFQGSPLFGIYCIQSGTVKRVKSLDNGEETIISLSENGDFFGGQAILSNSIARATYSLVAVQDSTLYFYDKSFILGLLKKYPQLATNIISKYQFNIERDEVRILSLSKKSVRERVAETLLNLASSYGKEVGVNKTNIPLMLSRIELSSLAGMANETFIRTLSEFQKEGMIKLMNNVILVTDNKELQYCTGAVV
ncbi:MAG: Crp/Fnr family transcriptional regulator [Bdellovibrio sp.]|nr:Crp/Fnr family transcriptional regulator [Bdellovibrio sp.]